MGLSAADAIVGWGQAPARRLPNRDEEALESCSRALSGIAVRLAPSVARVRVGRGSSRGSRVGSAVAITSDGCLVTSAHLLGAATSEIGITLVDGRELEAGVAGADALSDLAVLRVRPGELVPADLGDADQLSVGQLVVAVANQHGFGTSAAAGVVSTLARALPADGRAAAPIAESVIQTDARLEPASSGAALVDARGRLVAIATAATGAGLGHAVPINRTTRELIDALRRYGRVRRSYVGIAGGTRPLPPQLTRELEQDYGFEVVDVVPGSPAEQAGFRAGDVIVACDDTDVEDAGDLQALMTGELADTIIETTLVRAGEVIALDLVPLSLGR